MQVLKSFGILTFSILRKHTNVNGTQSGEISSIPCRNDGLIKKIDFVHSSQVVLVLVGNKGDLESSRAVPLSKAEQYARSVGAAHFQTSAKFNRGKLTFHYLTTCLSISELHN